MAEQELDLFSSPAESWQRRAHDLLRSCGASLYLCASKLEAFASQERVGTIISRLEEIASL
jgi:hypothetical protein